VGCVERYYAVGCYYSGEEEGCRGEGWIGDNQRGLVFFGLVVDSAC